MPGTDFLDQFTVWRVKDKPGVRYVWFNSVQDILDCIKEGQLSHWSNLPWRKDAYGDWAGARSMEEALEYLQYGWPEVAEAIFLEDAALALNREIESEFEPIKDVTGGAVNIGAYVQGLPEDMINFRVETRHKKTVKVLFNICASGTTGKSQIIQRGHTVTSICDYLERSGYRVRIDVADTAYGWGSGKSHWTLAFCAKDFNQPLDFGRIGYMLGSPAMLRRIFFGVEASSKSWGRDFGGTFGCVAPVHSVVGNSYDYVFDYHTPINVSTANKLVEYVVSGKATHKDITGYQEEEADDFY